MFFVFSQNLSKQITKLKFKYVILYKLMQPTPAPVVCPMPPMHAILQNIAMPSVASSLYQFSHPFIQMPGISIMHHQSVLFPQLSIAPLCPACANATEQRARTAGRGPPARPPARPGSTVARRPVSSLVLPPVQSRASLCKPNEAQPQAAS